MTTHTIRTAFALLAFSLVPCLAPAPVAGQSGEETGFSGDILIGYRSVDVSGADRKFREDVNLDDGPRLFDLTFRFFPQEGQDGFADRIELDMNNLGGDPFETLALTVEKRGSYDFRYDRRVSDYFYNDLIVPPALANPDSSTGGDFHTFDFERVQDRARLDFDLSSRAKLLFGFDRYTKKGEATTTLDVSRDEFELDRVIDESFNDYFAGFEYSWDKTTLVVQQQFRDYENLVEIFLPGFSEGENVIDDNTTLDFFFLDQPYDLESEETSAQVVFTPTDRLRIRLHAAVQDTDVNVTAQEESQGNDFAGRPFTTDLEGDGRIDRSVDLFDVELTYLITDRLAFVGNVRDNSLDQDGDFAFGTDVNVGAWEIETTGVQAGLEFYANPELTITGGLSFEDRSVDFGHSTDGVIEEIEEEDTERDGWFGIVSWRPTSAFRLTAALEDNSFDDPFTLVSPTDRQRIRVTGRYRFDNRVFLSGSYRITDYENSNSGWGAETEQTQLRVGWETTDLSVSFGYSLVDITRDIDQLVQGGSRTELFDIFYEASSDFLDGRLRYDVNDRVTVGGMARLYENDGTFGLERDDYRAFVDLILGEGYLLHLGYRTLDYDEQDFNFDDYDADIAEIGIGYRF